jgi:methanogenic corrinoid protein MtbC1
MTPDGGDPSAPGLVRIGDLARRVRVSVDTLRAWERRYGLLNPQRSAGGFRLYSSTDEATVRTMIAEIGRGFPPSEAAKLALSGRPISRRADVGFSTLPDRLDAARSLLRDSLEEFDGRRAHGIFDDLLAEFTLNAVLAEAVLPCLRDLGDRWERGEVTVAQEHFASNLIRERLLSLARQWDLGRGPRAVLACAPGERHDIGLICFGVVLGASGWRITFLGPDTPIDTLVEAGRALEPDILVVAAIEQDRFTAVETELRAAAGNWQVLIAGEGATQDVARSMGTGLLIESPVAAATQVAAR